MKKPVSANVMEPGRMSSNRSGLKPTNASATPLSAARDGVDASRLVRASGELDLSTVEPFKMQVAHAVASNAPRVVIDLRDVTFIDSTTLSVIVQAHNRLSAHSRDLTIKTQQPLVRRLFEITGLSTVLDIKD